MYMINSKFFEKGRRIVDSANMSKGEKTTPLYFIGLMQLVRKK